MQCALAAHETAKKRPNDGSGLPPGFILFSRREALKLREKELLKNRWANYVPPVCGNWRTDSQPGVIVAIIDEGKLAAVNAQGRLSDPAPIFTASLSRGFVHMIDCSLEDWAGHCGELLAGAPVGCARLESLNLPGLGNALIGPRNDGPGWEVRLRWFAGAHGAWACSNAEPSRRLLVDEIGGHTRRAVAQLMTRADEIIRAARGDEEPRDMLADAGAAGARLAMMAEQEFMRAFARNPSRPAPTRHAPPCPTEPTAP